MRVLVRCHQCARQYDGSGQAPGERFHCLCGQLVTIPERREFEASVVRCSSCGGTREGREPDCRFCGAAFTLHERDMHTTCPDCLARISDRAKFCHHCGTPIAVVGSVGEETDRPCPSCGPAHKLSSRVMNEAGLAVLECHRCAGMWLEGAVFLKLERRMLELAASGIGNEHREIAHSLPRRPPGDQNLYRKCPTCQVIMHRRNYGPGSGIVIDHCREHGYWFDQQELDVILRWIRTGGLLASHRRRQKIQRDNDRLKKLLDEIDERRRRYTGRLNETDHWKL